MSARRKNSRRLRDLRFHGVPIDGNYVLTEEWGAMDAGEKINQETQRQWLSKLGPIRRGMQTVLLPKIGRRGVRRGRLA